MYIKTSTAFRLSLLVVLCDYILIDSLFGNPCCLIVYFGSFLNIISYYKYVNISIYNQECIVLYPSCLITRIPVVTELAL